jgi:hypothetical protein
VDQRRLVTAEQAAAKDDGDVGRGHAVVQRTATRVDLESGVLEKSFELRLAGSQQKDPLPSVFTPLVRHRGIFPVDNPLEAFKDG